MGVGVYGSASVDVYAGVHVGVGVGMDVAVRMGGYRWSWSGAGTVHDTITTVLRALNHHLTPLRQMATITMANLQCQYNKCVPPFADPRTDLTRPTHIRSYQSFLRSAAATWLTAHNALTSARLQVVQTDQSHLITAKFAHIRNMASVCGQTPPSEQLVRATAVPAHESARIDDWMAVVKDGAVDNQRWGQDARDFATRLSLPALAPHDLWATLSRQGKLHKYEDTVHVAFIRRQLYGQPNDDARHGPDLWATDGSYNREDNCNKSSSSRLTATSKDTDHVRGSRHVTLSAPGR